MVAKTKVNGGRKRSVKPKDEIPPPVKLVKPGEDFPLEKGVIYKLESNPFRYSIEDAQEPTSNMELMLRIQEARIYLDKGGEDPDLRRGVVQALEGALSYMLKQYDVKR